MKIHRMYNIAVIYLGLVFFFACSSDKSPEPADCNANPVTIEGVTLSDANCGLADGSIEINASGGSGNYQYSIDGINYKSENTFNDLLAGNYEITVMDANECMVTTSVSIESANGMMVESEVAEEAGCGSNLGIINVFATGGVAPYQYRTEEGEYQDESTLEGLMAGSQQIFVRDANGCELSATIEMPSGTSLELDVLPILTTNCAVSGCHDGNNGIGNWSDVTEVINNADDIMTRTGNGTMPPDDPLSDVDIQTIACWVEDGAENN